MNIGEVVKLNPELCKPELLANPLSQFGKLNYFAFMLEWECEVVKTFKDDYHGEMIEIKVLNDPDIDGNVVFRQDEVILGVSKMLKMNYELIGKVHRFKKEIERLKLEETKLIEERAGLKELGLPITHKDLKANWAKKQKVTKEIDRLNKNTEMVYEVKHKTGTYYMDCSEDKIPTELRRIIRKVRSERKVNNVEVKDIGGGLTLEKLGKVMTKGGRFLELNEKYAMQIIKEHKKPTTSENYVGIEIEMISSKSIEEMNKELIKARLHRFVNVGTDGSIQAEVSGLKTMELRICLPESLLETKLKEITQVLRKNDCYANRSCGMHVHVDMRNRDPELVYRNFFRVQQLLIDSQPTSRRTNSYCKPATKPSKKLSEFNDERYQAINTASYEKNDMKTIEIRIHEGTVKFKDIFNWTMFLTGIASVKTDLAKEIKTTKELRELNILQDSVISHLEERIEEYSA